MTWLEELMNELFGSSRVVSRGVLHDAPSLPGLVAEEGSEPSGVLLYRLHEQQCEVVVLISLVRRQGVGRSLMAAVEAIATDAGCVRLWLITTNDNRGAIDFYRAIGMRLVAIHRGAVRAARELKPEIPEFGEEGIPIEDELEFELLLDRG